MIRVETDTRGVVTLWLARPDKHNALNSGMISGLADAARQVGADSAVRVVVLAAEGRSFCAGGDLRWMQDQIAATRDQRRNAARDLAEMLETLSGLPKPLIGRVQGNAFGGGVGMACVCDVTIGVDSAKFGLTETRLGLIPATIGPHVVSRMGLASARQVFMSGRLFGAEEALRLGILSKQVSVADLDAAIEAEVAPYLACAPGAVAAAKALARNLGGEVTREQIDGSIEALLDRWEGDEAPEGIAAFFEKRPAAWMRED